MSSDPEIISVSGHGPVETIPGVIRGIACCAAFVAIAWFDHTVSKYAIGGIAIVASPSLARAVIAPFLARILRAYVPNQTSDPILTKSGSIKP